MSDISQVSGAFDISTEMDGITGRKSGHQTGWSKSYFPLLAFSSRALSSIFFCWI